MSIISLYEKSEKLFFVGGIVRDELLGKQSPDIDLTFVGNAIEFVKQLNIGEITQINEDFGSVHLKFNNNTVDITSTRSEYYPNKGQLPIINKIGCSLKEDVLRRDFTINALAKNCKSGEIIDYVNGIADLKNKKLRVMHDKSFIDDPTRIIRGLKFAIRLNFNLDKHTKILQDDYLNNVDYNMSFKRLKDELKDAFSLNKQEVLDKFIEDKMYKLLSKNDYEKYICNVEKYISPYLNEIKNIWLIYLGGFDLSNLSLTRNEQNIIDDYKSLLTSDLSDDFNIYKNFETKSIESILIYGITKDSYIVNKYLTKLRHIKISISGEDLKQLGYKPSKDFALALDAVLQAKLKNSNITSAEELNIAKNTCEHL